MNILPTERPAEHNLLSLLDYLAAAHHPDMHWRGWRIARADGSGNNILYRATSDSHDLAIKFTIRDTRDRAGREYAALLALQRAGLSIAPQPLYLDRDRYPQPVVVQSWLAGAISAAPPANDQEWRCLLEHYTAIHTITPETSAVVIQPAVQTMRSAADGIQQIHQQLAVIPEEHQPAALRDIVRGVERTAFPEWPPPALALCRDDPNTLNVVRRPHSWASVDWENSGWGDPAYEISDVMTHPAYADVPAARWDWAIATYCALRGDPGAAERIRVYAFLMHVWWVARLARALYEIPRGGDRRLVARPAGWQADMQSKYERYLALVHMGLHTRIAQKLSEKPDY